MNGHSAAETLAFRLMEIRQRRGELVGDARETPVFVLAAGWGSGERQLARRFPFAIASDPAVSQSLLDGFSRQLVHAEGAMPNGARGQEHPAQAESAVGAAAVSAVAGAQARFLRAVCQSTEEIGARWGAASCSISGDYAACLKVLFPRAKFVLRHRNPLDAFARYLADSQKGGAMPRRDPSLAARFAQRWSDMVAGFALWSEKIGGILIGYDGAVRVEPSEIEEYAEARLSAIVPSPLGEQGACAAAPLHHDDVEAIVQCAGAIASRFGYRLALGASSESANVGEPRANIYRAVHTAGAGPASCAVLVPAMRYVEPDCEKSLRDLERRGYVVRRVYGCSPIDHARSRLATAALEQGFEETLWIDADTAFDPEAVDRLRSHGVPIIAGLCSRRAARGGLAMAPIPGTNELLMGDGAGVVEVLYAGTGFLLVRTEVYIAIQRRFNLPLCDADRPNHAIPFFMPMLEEWGGRMSYLGEDYAFCRRARLCGYKIMADASIRLWHIGSYHYGYEDAGTELQRLASYRHTFETHDDRG